MTSSWRTSTSSSRTTPGSRGASWCARDMMHAVTSTVQGRRIELERHEGHARELAAVSGAARQGGRAGLHSCPRCPHAFLCSQFSLHLNMAQECMAIFERDKLPAVANVEQVRTSVSHQASLVLTRAELRHGGYGRGQDTQNAGGGDGAAAGQPGSCVRCAMTSRLAFR